MSQGVVEDLLPEDFGRPVGVRFSRAALLLDERHDTPVQLDGSPAESFVSGLSIS